MAQDDPEKDCAHCRGRCEWRVAWKCARARIERRRRRRHRHRALRAARRRHGLLDDLSAARAQRAGGEDVRSARRARCDAVLGLRHNGHRGPIHMVSRRGLLPHEHRFFDSPPAACPDAKSVSELLGKVRGSAREASDAFDNWRVAIDGVRPKTNALWQEFTLADQRRFVRHVMPYWNAHRHRMAPEPHSY